ncbi:hypothetical protein ACM55F_07660 [Flavobacterium sp. XS2P12]|uniref:hypothetical protein n=1 Tax=Flavobacterium melibiosi TaxID=3398734 RepID=UPI003A84A209
MSKKTADVRAIVFGNSIFIYLFVVLMILSSPQRALAQWYVDNSAASSHIGGPSTYGPYNTKAEAEAFIKANEGYGMKLLPGGKDVSTSATSQSDSSYNEAETARKNEESERLSKEKADKKLRDDAEAKKRKEDVARREKEKDDALNRMKGNSSSNFGLKTTTSNVGGLKSGQTNSFGLKSSTNPDVNLPPKYKKYLWEVDHAIVPLLSWEQIINMNIEQLRIGQANDKYKYLMILDNALVGAFDLFASSPTTTAGVTTLAGFKVLIIGLKSTIAAMDEAEVIVFEQNATYETMLRYLKDKTKGPQLLAALKSTREKKPLPPGISPEIARLAAACQSPEAGISSVHIVMNAMLSKEAKWAFFQVAHVEGMELMNGGIRALVATDVQDRFSALRDANEKINIGQKFLATEKDPLVRSVVESKLEALENKMKPFEIIPEGILSFISSYEDYKKIKKQQ